MRISVKGAGAGLVLAGTGLSKSANTLSVAAAQTSISSITAPTNTALTLATLDNNKDVVVTPHGTGKLVSGNVSIFTSGGNALVDSTSGSLNLRTNTAASITLQTNNTTALTLNSSQQFLFAGVGALGGAAISATTALNLPAGTTAIASMRLAHGVAPTSPVNGDVWTTTAGLFVRVNGATVGPLS